MGKNYNNNRNQNRNNDKKFITPLEKEKLENEQQLKNKYAGVKSMWADARMNVINLENEAMNTLNLLNQVTAINKSMLNEKYPNCEILPTGEIIEKEKRGV